MKTRNNWVMVALALLVLGFLLVLPVGAQETAGQTPAAAATTQKTDQPPSILSLTLGELIGILFGGGALAVAIGKILWDGNQPGATIDQRLTQRVETAHSDREWIERLERAYMLAGSQTQRLVDAFTGVLTNVSPLTGVKVDDALLKLLQDIQKPGTVGIQANDPAGVAAAATEAFGEAMRRDIAQPGTAG